MFEYRIVGYFPNNLVEAVLTGVIIGIVLLSVWWFQDRWEMWTPKPSSHHWQRHPVFPWLLSALISLALTILGAVGLLEPQLSPSMVVLLGVFLGVGVPMLVVSAQYLSCRLRVHGDVLQIRSLWLRCDITAGDIDYTKVQVKGRQGRLGRTTTLYDIVLVDGRKIRINANVMELGSFAKVLQACVRA